MRILKAAVSKLQLQPHREHGLPAESRVRASHPMDKSRLSEVASYPSSANDPAAAEAAERLGRKPKAVRHVPWARRHLK